MKHKRDWDKCAPWIIKRYGRGESLSAIAAHYQVEYRTIRGLIEKWGIDMRGQEETAPSAPQQQEEAPRPPDKGTVKAKILEMARAGVPDIDIVNAVAEMGVKITRGVVIGYRHRNGIENKKAGKRMMSGGKTDAIRRARDIKFGKAAPTTPKPPSPRWDAHLSKCMLDDEREPEARQAPPRAPRMPKSDIKPVPVRPGEDGVRRWVTFDLLTGCRWVEGECETLRYCNAPVCKIQRPGMLPETARYCAFHYEARRVTNYTKIVSMVS